MFSDNCPICGTKLKLLQESFQSIYECSKEIIPHYGIAFSNEGRLILEYFLFAFNGEQMGVRVDFENKETEIYRVFMQNNGGFKAPCYLGPGDLDKVKNYIMIL